MISAPLHPQEDLRLAALRRYEVLDTRPERELDEITELASLLCGTPMALVSLVDEDRQWFKSRQGLDATETPRDVAFCAHAILDPAPVFEVTDATEDPRFHDNPLVTGGPEVRFYAGAKVKSADGYPLGTLCVIDHQVAALTSDQRRGLELLARRVEAHLEQRSLLRQLAESTQHSLQLEGILKTYTGREVWKQVDSTLSGEHPAVPDDLDRTFVFADLNQFTQLSGVLSDRELASTLNRRLGGAVTLVEQHGGDVEKFIGDCIFAVFPDPVSAVDFAADLQAEASEAPLVAGRSLTFSIGIHSGPAQRVHIGNDARRDNTLIGEAVNIAARLQSAAPPGEAMVSEATLAAAGRRARRPPRQVTLKGVRAPVTVYLLDIEELTTARMKSVSADYLQKR